MEKLSIGKYRRLQRCSTVRGAIAVMALDHRNNLRNALNPATPEQVSYAEMAAFKQQVTRSLAPVASAVLLDPEIGAAQSIAAGALSPQTGLVLAVEATGYTGEPNARSSQVLPGWSVAQTARLGADAVKLLVYYHPGGAGAAETEALVARVAAECRSFDLPLFVEPLSFSLKPGEKKLPPAERRQVVIDTARRLTPPGVDVLKAEFPLDIKAVPDESAWEEACGELSQASRAPWILLSASVDFDTYLRQVTVACRQGASGVAVGRAVWQEAPDLSGAARQDFLELVARQRMQRLTALCEALARPWTEFYLPEEAGENWYKRYGAGF